MNRVKTWVLIAALGALFVVVGELIWGGSKGLWIGLLIGLGFNLAMYWFSRQDRDRDHAVEAGDRAGVPGPLQDRP